MMGASSSACLSDLAPDVGSLGTHADAGAAAANGGDNGSGAGNGGDNGSNGDSGGDSGSDSGSDHDDDGGTDESPTGHDNNANGDPGPTPDPCMKDSDPTTDVSFSADVWPILAGCSCHDPDDADPFAILESGLSIDNYTTLRKGGDSTGTKIIVPGDRCESIILEKLNDSPSFGDRMPLDGPYLSVDQIQLISDWIVEGAREN